MEYQDSDEGLKERMQGWGLVHKAFTPDTPLAELGLFSKTYPEAKTLAELKVLMQQSELPEQQKGPVFMYHHTITFHSLRDFCQFTLEIGPWLEKLMTFDSGEIDPDGHYVASYTSKEAIEKEHQLDVQQGYHWIADTEFNEDHANRHDGWPVLTLSVEGEIYVYTQPDWDRAAKYLYDIGLDPREDVHYTGKLAELIRHLRVPGSEITDRQMRSRS